MRLGIGKFPCFSGDSSSNPQIPPPGPKAHSLSATHALALTACVGDLESTKEVCGKGDNTTGCTEALSLGPNPAYAFISIPVPLSPQV